VRKQKHVYQGVLRDANNTPLDLQTVEEVQVVVDRAMIFDVEIGDIVTMSATDPPKDYVVTRLESSKVSAHGTMYLRRKEGPGAIMESIVIPDEEFVEDDMDISHELGQ